MKKDKKRGLDRSLMELGERAFWKEFEDQVPEQEQRYVIVRDGEVIVLRGKLRAKAKKIRV